MLEHMIGHACMRAGGGGVWGGDDFVGKIRLSGMWRNVSLARSGGFGSAACACGSVSFGICTGGEIFPIRNFPWRTNPRTKLHPPPLLCVLLRGRRSLVLLAYHSLISFPALVGEYLCVCVCVHHAYYCVWMCRHTSPLEGARECFLGRFRDGTGHFCKIFLP